MDLSGGHENCSSNNRPDLTIPMPSCLVAGAMAAAAAAAAQDKQAPLIKPQQQPQTPQQQQQQLIVSTTNNGNALAAAAAAAAELVKAEGKPPSDASGGTAGGTPAAPGSKKPVRYRECLKNHAAGIGGHALDGCGEFMPNKEDEASLLCGACDCHRNFHRREVEGEKPPPLLLGPSGEVLDASGRKRGPGSDFGTPGSTGGGTPGSMKKRFRTKFSNEQKERMFVLSEKLGWRIQKHDEAEVAQFCADTGVKRHVLKVWMHNNKHTFGNKRLSPADEPT